MCSDRPAGAPSEACLHKCGDLYCEDGIYHFGPEAIRKGQLTWQLESESGEIAASGKLFVLVVDPVKDIEKRPAMQQLLTSVRNYVASDRFAPTVTLQLYELDALFDYNKIQETETRSDEAIKQLLNQQTVSLQETKKE